jgi:hypothetical protein
MLLSCSGAEKTKGIETAPPSQSAASVCSAIQAPGTLEARFAGVFPLELGGVMYVLSDAPPVAVTNVLDSLGLAATSVVDCHAEGTVVFIPGVHSSGALKLESRIHAAVPTARTKDRLVVPPAISSR